MHVRCGGSLMTVPLCLYCWIWRKLWKSMNIWQSYGQMYVLLFWLTKYNNCNCKLCTRPHDMPPPLYAPRCSPAPDHTRLTPAAPSAPCAMNIHDRQAAARSGYDYGVVHNHNVVTRTANRSSLVTLTFWPRKWCPSLVWRGRGFGDNALYINRCFIYLITYLLPLFQF